MNKFWYTPNMRYSWYKKILFYITLAFYKLTSFFECKNYKMKVLFNEFNFFLCMLGIKKLSEDSEKIITLKTKFGTFSIRDITSDINIASPAYERQDLNELIKYIKWNLQLHHKVLFIDIGACFGKYTVTIGNIFKKYSKQIDILAFEPDKQNYNLLKKNVLLNNLKNVTLYKIALSNQNTTQKFYYYSPMKQIVTFTTKKPLQIITKTLDQILISKGISPDTNLVVKIDIEGNELKALQGSKKIFSLYKNSFLLIEDSFKKIALQQHLNNKFHFFKKLTNYNSFWTNKNLVK